MKLPEVTFEEVSSSPSPFTFKSEARCYLLPSSTETESRDEHQGKSPIKKVIFNMMNAILGAGVIGLPYVFSEAGLFGGLFLMFFFALISSYSLTLLIISAKKCNQKNYEDLCEHLFGLKGYIFVMMVLFVFDFGASLSYLIILGDAASNIINIWGYDTLFDRQMVILFCSVVIIFPTVIPKDISKIEEVSTVSVLTVILIMIVIIYEWMIPYEFTVRDDINWVVNVNGIPMAIGIIAFSFVCHDTSFLLYNTLKNPTVSRWSILAYVGSFSAVVICACFAIPGYMTFGGSVQDNILNNYAKKDIIIICSRVIYCLTMALTYPCSFFVVRHVCVSIFYHNGKDKDQSIKTICWSKHLMFTIPIFAANVLMALYIQNLGIVMSVSGSLSAVVLAFVLPSICYLKTSEYDVLFWREKVFDRKLLAFKKTFPPLILCVFGIVVAIGSTSLTIIQHFDLKFTHTK